MHTTSDLFYYDLSCYCHIGLASFFTSRRLASAVSLLSWSVGSLMASQEAHDSVQDVLCRRDAPIIEVPTKKSKLSKTRVPRKHQHTMQEM